MKGCRHIAFTKILFLVLISFITQPAIAQDSAHSLYPYNKKRVKLVTASNIGIYGGMMVGLNAAWYSKFPRSNFHFFNDNDEWLQIDKVGHIYSAYTESKFSADLWKWTGLPGKQRIWIGGLTGVAYQTIIETLDGFSSEYGWSWGDFTANVLGSGTYISQELLWEEQKFKLKFSFHKKNYPSPDLTSRANSIFGKTEGERFLKDYNAQTYWVSASAGSLFPDAKIPKWLALAFGYGAEGMFGARSNVAKDKNGNIVFDRSDIRRYRQWFLSPDIDLTRIKTKSKVLRTAFSILNIFKIPAPSLEFSKGKLRGNWMHF